MLGCCVTCLEPGRSFISWLFDVCVFMSFFTLSEGILRFLSAYSECLWISPRTHAMIVMRG